MEWEFLLTFSRAQHNTMKQSKNIYLFCLIKYSTGISLFFVKLAYCKRKKERERLFITLRRLRNVLFDIYPASISIEFSDCYMKRWKLENRGWTLKCKNLFTHNTNKGHYFCCSLFREYYRNHTVAYLSHIL